MNSFIKTFKISFFGLIFILTYLFISSNSTVFAQVYGSGQYGDSTYTGATPTNTPAATHTPTPTNTPLPTPTPAVSLTALSPDPNSDNTPSLTGTATSSGSTISLVEYQIDSTSGDWGSCTASDGTFDEASEGFTCTVATLDDGVHTIYVRAKDAVTQYSTNSSDVFTIDTTPPGIVVNSLSNDLTNDSTPLLSGTANDISSIISSVEYQVDGTGATWNACTALDGSFSSITESFTCTPSSLSDGAHTVYFRATDNLSNTTATADITSLDFTVDTTAPTVTLIDLSPSIIANTSPAISGTINDTNSLISTVQYQIDGTGSTWSSCTSNDGAFDEASENITCTVSTSLTNGSHTMFVRATDTAGNTDSGSGVDSSSFTVDTSAPTINVTALSPDPTTDTTPPIGGTAVDSASTITVVQYQLDSTSGSWSDCDAGDGTFDETTESFSCQVGSTLSNGSHTIYFKATDNLSNITSGTFPSDTFAVDTTPPSITLNALSPNPTDDSTPTFTGSGTELIGTIASVKFQVDGTGPSWTNCDADDGTFDEASESFSCTTSTLADGAHIIYIQAIDSTGNTSSSYTSRSFDVDTTPPIDPGVSITAVTDPTNDSTPLVQATATDADGTIVSAEFQVDGTAPGSWNACTSDDGTFDEASEAISCQLSSLSNGAHTVYVRATDNDANTSIADSDTFTVDTDVPAISITALTPDPNSDSTPSITGSVTDSDSTVASVQYQMNGTSGSWSSCTADDGTFDEASESFTCTVASSLSDGSNTIHIRSTDAAGNVTTSTDIKTDTFVIDTTAPSISLTALSPDPNSDNTPSVTGTAVDVGSTVNTVQYQIDSTSGSWTSCTADDSTFDEASEDFTCNVGSSLPDGSHTIYIKGIDTLSNATSSGYTSDTFTIDTAAPSASLNTTTPNPTSDNTPLLSGTANDTASLISTIEYQIDGTGASWSFCSATDGAFDELVEAFSCNVGSTLSDGAHTMYIKTTDALSNSTTNNNASADFTVDTTAPAITLNALSPDPNSSNTPSLTGNVLDSTSPISAVQFQIDGTSGSWSSCTATDGAFDTAAENFTCSVSSALSEGNHTMYVRASDNLSNITSSGSYASDSFTINAVGPTISSISASPTDTTVSITWTTDDSSSSQVVYGPASSFLITSTSETDTSPRVTSHSVSLSDLVSCTTYYYVVRSKDSTDLASASSNNSFTTTGCTGDATITSQTQGRITTAGGSISLYNDGTHGVRITAPASYYASNLYFQIKKLAKNAVLSVLSSPTGYTAVNDFVYDFQALSDVETNVTSFDENLTITMTYTDSDVRNINESTLKIYHNTGSGWTELSGCTVDTGANSVSCTTSSFSIFALFGVYQESSSGGNNNSGSSNSGSSVQTCSALKPIGSPYLFQVDRTKETATMHFAPSQHPYDRFVMSFGTDENAEGYNATATLSESSGAITYDVYYLKPGQTYYFKVRAMNNCEPGDWSNVVRATGVSATSSRIVKYYPNWTKQVSYAVQTVTKRVSHVVNPPSNTQIPEPVQQVPQQQPAVQSAPKQTQPPAPPKQSSNWFGTLWKNITSIF